MKKAMFDVWSGASVRGAAHQALGRPRTKERNNEDDEEEEENYRKIDWVRKEIDYYDLALLGMRNGIWRCIESDTEALFRN
jgi:hypothetical protein